VSYHSIPQVHTIAHSSVPISGMMTVNAVIEYLQRNTSIIALPVETEGRFEGLISRRNLFSQHLVKPFARDLYYRKPIRMLLDDRLLTMPSIWDVHKALDELIRRDPALENDCFGIMDDGRCTGVVAVADLILTISRLQAGLLDTLEQLSRRIRNEVEMARRIQADLLPVTPMEHSGITVAGSLVNSSEISGDFYDIFLPGGSPLGLMVADVTGHGVQAGLVTTAAKAGLQILLDSGISRPAQLLCGINRAILATGGQQLMMTALIALVEPSEQQIILSSAGHPYPWRFSANDNSWHEILLDPGFPLGFDGTATYPETTIPFLPGDTILLFSDGIIEAENRMEEAFGSNRFRQVLQEGCLLNPEQLTTFLLEEARKFSGNNDFTDDVTLLVATCTADC